VNSTACPEKWGDASVPSRHTSTRKDREPTAEEGSAKSTRRSNCKRSRVGSACGTIDRGRGRGDTRERRLEGFGEKIRFSPSCRGLEGEKLLLCHQIIKGTEGRSLFEGWGALANLKNSLGTFLLVLHKVVQTRGWAREKEHKTGEKERESLEGNL